MLDIKLRPLSPKNISWLRKKKTFYNKLHIIHNRTSRLKLTVRKIFENNGVRTEQVKSLSISNFCHKLIFARFSNLEIHDHYSSYTSNMPQKFPISFAEY